MTRGRVWTMDNEGPVYKSATTGKAGGLKYLNRSKRLKTWRHLKVAYANNFNWSMR